MSPRLRIAQIVSGRVLNGAVGHCLMLCNQLSRRGHHVTLVHRAGLDIGDRLDSAVQRTPASLRLTPGAILALGRGLRGGGVDVLHTHMSDGHTYGVLIRRLFGIPCVATAHSSHLQLHWLFNDRVIAPSTATARFHHRINRVPMGRIAVIPNFLETSRWPVVTPQLRLAARARLGLADDALVIGAVGEINFKKRQSDLIVAVAAMRAQPAAQLIHVGGVAKDAEIGRVEAVAPRLGNRLRRLGVRGDVADILPAFDIFALSSRAEEAPIAVLEAMAAGLPVVATDVGGLAEMVLEGETGLLAPPSNPAALAACLDRLAGDADLRRTMGEAGRSRVEQAFAPGPIVDRIEAVLVEAAQLRQAKGSLWG